MTRSGLSAVSSECIEVRGELDFENVLALKLEGEALLAAAGDYCEINFSGVTRAGSAALTLLCAWLRHASALDKHIEFTHLPKDLFGVAQVSGIDQILPIKVD